MGDRGDTGAHSGWPQPQPSPGDEPPSATWSLQWLEQYASSDLHAQASWAQSFMTAPCPARAPGTRVLRKDYGPLMDFALSEEQEALYKTVADFAAKVVAPEAGLRDREGRFDRAVWDACAEIGLTGLPIAEEHGGQGTDAVTTGVALEALAYGGRDAGLGLSLGAHLTIGSLPIELHGTQEQKDRYLPKLTSGE